VKPVEDLESLLPLDPFTLEIGYGLIPLVEAGAPLLARIKAIRKQMVTDMGFIVRRSISRQSFIEIDAYSILIKGVEIASGEVILKKYLAISPARKRRRSRHPTKDPAFGLQALWMTRARRQCATGRVYRVDVPSVITTHLTEVIKPFPRIARKQDVQKLLDTMTKTQPKVVEELVPGLLSSAWFRGYSRFTEGRISIRDLQTILETLSTIPHNKGSDMLTNMSAVIVQEHYEADTEPGRVSVCYRHRPQVERLMVEAIQTGPQGMQFFNMDPVTVDKSWRA